MSELGSLGRPLRVAVVGAGPSGFYAIQALAKQKELHFTVDLFDRLPTPFGLVRGGVAPDHQKIKSVAQKYDKLAQRDGFRFFGNVQLGRDLHVPELVDRYDQVVYAVGCEGALALGIEGEGLGNVHSATEFVYWYNGHPSYRDYQFDFTGVKRIAVVGNGNVAMDVCRVLVRDRDDLGQTDIADYALAQLREAEIEEVVLLGRRGPAQAAFSPKEIEEIGELPEISLEMTAEDIAVDPVTARWLATAAPRSAHQNLAYLTKAAERGPNPGAVRKVGAKFLTSPSAFLGSGKLEAIRLVRNELYDKNGTPRPRATDDQWEEPFQMVFSAIGYKGARIEGVPHEEWGGTIPNTEGRVTDGENGPVRPGQYAVGWAKRGPSGLIGTNAGDSAATVARMLEDLPGTTPAADDSDIADVLAERGVRVVTYPEWQRIDAEEQRLGASLGRPRVKFTTVAEMLAFLDG